VAVGGTKYMGLCVRFSIFSLLLSSWAMSVAIMVLLCQLGGTNDGQVVCFVLFGGGGALAYFWWLDRG
jgi:hypothetical protein